MNEEPLRVAMIAPPWYDVPPNAYGGIKSMCADLVDGLVARGHDVTLVGVGEHRVRTRFHATRPTAQPDLLGKMVPEALHTAAVARYLDRVDVDVVHDHTLTGPFTVGSRRAPTVVTAHGPVEPMRDYYAWLAERASLVAISQAQRFAAPDIAWAATVHNAVDASRFPYREDKEDFLLFLGRFCPEKGPHLAIEAARAAGARLVLAGKMSEPHERDYFDACLRPRVGRGVEWIGELEFPAKVDLLGRARGMIFPIQWEEPFGLVMVEAMACGTPVVTMRRGAAPEVVEHGVTGFLCERPAELPQAIDALATLQPRSCRERVEARFDVPVMVRGYERVYRLAVERWKPPFADESLDEGTAVA
jgi:glycosyltransferase involved in cell wall biosynthesis